jgi:hypothetical protein
MYLKFSMDPYPNSVHEDHLKHKAPKINVQNSTVSQLCDGCVVLMNRVHHMQ